MALVVTSPQLQLPIWKLAIFDIHTIIFPPYTPVDLPCPIEHRRACREVNGRYFVSRNGKAIAVEFLILVVRVVLSMACPQLQNRAIVIVPVLHIKAHVTVCDGYGIDITRSEAAHISIPWLTLIASHDGNY